MKEWSLTDVVVGSNLPSWYEVDILSGAAECFIAAPEVAKDKVFTAIVKASATDGMGAVADVMARPANVVAVVGVVVKPPSLVAIAIPPDAIARSPIIVGAVADGIDSNVNLIICVGAVVKFMAGPANLLVVKGVVFKRFHRIRC